MPVLLKVLHIYTHQHTHTQTTYSTAGTRNSRIKKHTHTNIVLCVCSPSSRIHLLSVWVCGFRVGGAQQQQRCVLSPDAMMMAFSSSKSISGFIVISCEKTIFRVIVARSLFNPLSQQSLCSRTLYAIDVRESPPPPPKIATESESGFVRQTHTNTTLSACLFRTHTHTPLWSTHRNIIDSREKTPLA